MIKNEGNVKNFWNGFIAGCVTAGACLYAFGTKNGRNSLYTILEFSENLDTNIHKLVKQTQLGGQKKQSKEKSSSFESVSSILDKIRHVSKRA